MSKLTDWVLDLFFPTRCIFCRKLISPGRPRICPSCMDTLPTADHDERKGDFFSLCVSALYYDDRVRDAIHRYKFEGNSAYYYAFGEQVASRVYEALSGKYDIITWVPLAPDRLRRRGYDQSELIARNAASRLRKPVVRTLKKRRGVHPQSLTKGAEGRKANISGAFSVIDEKRVLGKRVLLVDDIVTTGATLSECARMLLMSGAEEVLCATLARAD